MSFKDIEYVEIPRVTALSDTDKAVRCRFSDLGMEVWVPKSVIAPGSDVKESGDVGTLELAKWFAEKEELYDAD